MSANNLVRASSSRGAATAWDVYGRVVVAHCGLALLCGLAVDIWAESLHLAVWGPEGLLARVEEPRRARAFSSSETPRRAPSHSREGTEEDMHDLHRDSACCLMLHAQPRITCYM
eukprot:4790504-Prymnesium_polylepis.2